MVNSKKKGSRGELEFVHFLKDRGFEDADRSQQFCGANGDADVICDSLPVTHHIEVKRVQNLNVEKALQQAESDRRDHSELPIVAHRKNKEQWKVTLRAEAYLQLLKRVK